MDKLRFLASKNVPRSKCAKFESISSIHSFIHYTTKVRKYLGFAIVSGWMKMKHPYLVQWFRETEMPRIAGYFIPLLKKWSVEYAGRFA